MNTKDLHSQNPNFKSDGNRVKSGNFASGIMRDAFNGARAWHPAEWAGFRDREPGYVDQISRTRPHNTWENLLQGHG